MGSTESRDRIVAVSVEPLTVDEVLPAWSTDVPQLNLFGEPVNSTMGVDELNLVDVPFASASTAVAVDPTRPETLVRSTTQTVVLRNGRTLKREWSVIGSVNGLPVATTDRLLMALLKMAADQNNFVSPSFSFNPRDVIRLMGLNPTTGSNYERLLKDIRILQEVTIKFVRAWFDLEAGVYEKEIAISIIADYVINDAKPGRKPLDEVPEDGSCTVTWGPAFYRSLKSGYLKALDAQLFFNFRRPLTAKLYRIVDKAIYGLAVGDEAPPMQLVALANNLVMEKAPPSNLKQRLVPAFNELKREQVIGDFRFFQADERGRKTWFATFTVGVRLSRPGS